MHAPLAEKTFVEFMLGKYVLSVAVPKVSLVFTLIYPSYVFVYA
jgi:hypothetical protein